jgi:uncharacterized protein involved in exopolysaccharide biosynthesis
LRRYVATLFRLKELFLIPIITVPAIALIVTFYTGREYKVEAKVWVDPSDLLTTQVLSSSSSARVTPATLEASTLTDWLSTEAFRQEVIDRAGLGQAIEEGLWPVPSKLGEQVADIPVVRNIAKAMGVVTPVAPEPAEGLALKMVLSQVGASSEGTNLLIVTYIGTEPFLGKRLVEETLTVYNEKATDSDLRHSERAVTFYTYQVDQQKAKLDVAEQDYSQYLILYPEPLPGQIRPASETAELDRLAGSVRLERALYEDALRQLESVRVVAEAVISNRTESFAVIDAPVVPDQPRLASSALILNLIVGLTLGGMITTAGIIGITWTDRTVRTREDVEDAVSIPLVERVPLVSGFSSKKGPDVRAALIGALNPRDGFVARS